jgi:hypothetical protein
LWVSGAGDWKISTIGSQKSLGRLARERALEISVIDDLDHGMMRPGVRDRVAEQIVAFVDRKIALPPGARATTAETLDA